MTETEPAAGPPLQVSRLGAAALVAGSKPADTVEA